MCYPLQVIASLLCLLAMDFAPPVPPAIDGTSLTERLLAAQVADDLTMLQVCKFRGNITGSAISPIYKLYLLYVDPCGPYIKRFKPDVRPLRNPQTPIVLSCTSV